MENRDFTTWYAEYVKNERMYAEYVKNERMLKLFRAISYFCIIGCLFASIFMCGIGNTLAFTSGESYQNAESMLPVTILAIIEFVLGWVVAAKAYDSIY